MAKIHTLANGSTSRSRTRASCSCIKYRNSLRIVCFIMCLVTLCSIIFVNVTKSQELCFEWTPSLLCIANKHCAYIQRTPTSENYYMDLMPFINDNKCVLRNNVKDYMYKGIEKSIDLINTIPDAISEISSRIYNYGLGGASGDSGT